MAAAVNSTHQHHFMTREPKYKYKIVKRSSHWENKCSPKIELLNCGSHPRDMPRMSPYKSAMILSNLELDSGCWDFESVSMKWEVWLVTNDEKHDESVKTLEFFDKQNYFVEQGSLYYGVYKVKLQYNVIFVNKILSASASCYFEMVHLPIQTVISGGSKRYQYFKSPISLEIFTLVIPGVCDSNLGTGKIPPLTIIYEWQCDSRDKFCNPLKTIKPFRQINGPFVQFKEYNFTLKVQTVTKHFGYIKEQSQQTEFQTIKMDATSELEVSIKCLMNCGGSVFKSNPQEIIHLESKLGGDFEDHIKSIVYHWNYTIVGSTNNAEDIAEIAEKGLPKHVLVIKKNKLIENQKYIFTLSLGHSSYSEIVVETCALPKSPNCTIFPNSGIRAETYFTISCSVPKQKEDFLTTTLEFFDRYTNEETLGRYLGLTTTGVLKSIVLTRDKLFVRSTNIFGAYYEVVVNVQLSSPTQNSSVLNLKFGNHIHGNYINRIGLMTAYGDHLSSQIFSPNLTVLLLTMLEEEEIHIEEITGATLLINALHNIFCRPKSLDTISYLESEITIKIAKMLHRVSQITKDTVIYPFKSSPFVTTTRMLEITKYIMNCSSDLLGDSSTDGSNVLEKNIYDNMKIGAFYILEYLNNIITALAFKVLMSTEQINLYSKYIDVKLLNIGPNLESISQSLEKIQKPVNVTKNCFKTVPKFQMQVITFKKVPFWWASRPRDEINTHIIDLKHKYGADYVLKHGTTNSIFKVYLDVVVDFEPLTIFGSVKQPNPKDNPDVNDFVVAVHRIAPSVNSKTFVKFVGIESNTSLRGLILQNQRPDYDYMNLRSTILTNKSSSISLASNNNDTFLYLGILPGEGVKFGEAINYTFILFTATCKVRRYDSWMTGSKCKVTDETNKNQVSCACSKFTLTLGGKICVPENDLNPFSDISLLISVSDYPLPIILTVIIIIFYLFLLLWVNGKDKKNKKRANLIVLEDNDARDSYGYLVGVFTGSRFAAGTTSNVGIMLLGEEGISRSHILKSDQRSTLQANCDDWFLLYTRHHLGSLTNIIILMDYSGCRPNWYCSKIFVCDLQKYETDTFYVEKWFGISIQEIHLKMVKECATYKEINNFYRIFSENLEYGFRENHLWMSLLIGHPRSTVNSIQRLTVAFSSLFVTIGSSVLIYFFALPQTEDLAHYEISKETFVYGTLSGFVGFLFSFIFLQFFKASYKLVQCPIGYHEHLDGATMYHLERHRTILVVEPSWLQKIKKIIAYAKPCQVIPVQRNENNLFGVKRNRRMIVFSILLCIVVAVVNIHLTVTFGIHFGEIKSSLWITSILIGMIQTGFVTVPIRILACSLIFVVLKTRFFPTMSHIIRISETSQRSHGRNSYEEFSELLTKRKNLFRTHHSLHAFGELELQRKQTRIIVLWTSIYIFGCVLLLSIVSWLILEFDLHELCIINNTNCREIDTKESCQISSYSRLESYKHFLDKIQNDILPILYSKVWYNGEEKTLRTESFPSSGWLGNQGSRLIGPPRLRQIRVKNVDNCNTPKLMIDNSTHCFVRLSAETEDKDNYSTGWDVSDWIDCQFDEASWHFSDAKQAKGALIITPSGYVCHGGGYIFSLSGSEDGARLAIRNIIDTNWIDIYTRVLMLEYTTYNANKDIFTSVTYFAEATPYGFVVTSQLLDSLQLTYVTLSGIVFLPYFFIFLLHVLILINIMGMKNFLMNNWNLQEIVILVSYFVSAIYYSQTLIEKEKHGEYIKKQAKDEYFQIQILTSEISNMKTTISVLFCLVAFRMLRIIRFNADVRLYLHDLYSAIHGIVWIWVVLSMFLFVQWRLVMFLVVPPPGDSFKDLLFYQSDFKIVIYQYEDLHGKILAFLISLLTQIGMFSYVCSLTHFYKKGQLKRNPPPAGGSTQNKHRYSRLWESAYN